MMPSQHRRLMPNRRRLDELGKEERAHPIAAADLMADTMAGCIGACWRHWSISSMDRPASWSSFIILSYNNVHPIHMWSWRIHSQEEEDDKNNNNNKTHTQGEGWRRGTEKKKNKPWAESKGECGAGSSWEQKRPASPPPMYHCCSLAKSSRSPAQSSDAAAAMPSLSLSL